MDSLSDLEKKINSELTTKINDSKIMHKLLYLSIDNEDLLDVVLFLKTNKDTKFKQLTDITAVDYPENTKRFKMIYKQTLSIHNTPIIALSELCRTWLSARMMRIRFGMVPSWTDPTIASGPSLNRGNPFQPAAGVANAENETGEALRST